MPFASEAQRRWGHTKAGEKALGGPAAVHEWDTATEGKSLPERKSMKTPKHSFHETTIKHHHDGSRTVKHHHIDPAKSIEHAVPDLAGAQESMEQHVAGGMEQPASEPMAGAMPGA